MVSVAGTSGAGCERRGGVGLLTEIEEELGEHVEREERTVMHDQFIVSEADYDKEYCQHSETHELDRFAANCVYCCDSHPIAGNRTSTDKDEIANGSVVEDPVDVRTLCKTNRSQDDGVIQAETVAA